jgi:hypothetical protein
VVVGRLPRLDQPRVDPAEGHCPKERFLCVSVSECIGEQRPPGSRMHLMRSLQEIHPRHPRHPLIRDHDGDLFLAVTQPGENGQTAFG